MKKRIVVTGANGQLGKTIKDIFCLNAEELECVFVGRTELDVANKDKVCQFFNNHAFDYCVNCAAFTNVDGAQDAIHEAFAINADAADFLAQACKSSNTTLIHISTDYVFDGKKCTPYTETDPTNPINVYGRSKLEGERLIQKAMAKYFIIRTSWLYSQYPKNFVTTIAGKIKENADLSIVTSQRGTPTSCESLAKFIHWLIVNENKDYGIFHFSAKGETTWHGLSLKIAEQFTDYDRKKIKAVESFKTKAQRPIYSVMDNSKVQKIYHAQNDWSVELEKVMGQILNKLG
ncbi:MAG TPA: dTDP-4-dehydrorhamnose reductase [Aquaticitalea sp.]|nr:dTDP-4-dehydrorhamnose reductase [Aquaticitalea sp.]HNU58352.1 dTDP-4-dehydrorhamnose reductase [Aquaticitalea sp.]